MIDTSPINDALAALHGLPLQGINRAGTLLCVSLGEDRSAPIEGDPDRIASSHAVHVTCAWRFSGPDGIVAGAEDMYAAADPDTPGWNFDPGNPENAVADVRWREWMADHESRPLTVQRMSSDRCGGFVLHLSGDYALEVFPTGAGGVHEDREQWRLFEPGMGKPHFVWTDRGILERGLT